MKSGGIGYLKKTLTEKQIAKLCDDAIAQWKPAGRRVLLVIPDGTRSCPMDVMFRLLYKRIAAKAKCFDVLIALGTHPAMTEEQIYNRVGITKSQHKSIYPRAKFFNHMWKDPSHLATVGTLTKKEVKEITGGLLEMNVTITCNKMLLDHDLVIIVGPVFPHEVVGFSGGNKYLFPGLAGQEIIDFFHWLGALITNKEIIGAKYTPVRKVVDRSALMLKTERKAFCMVVNHGDLAGLYWGSAEDAWSAAADLSDKVHIVYKDRPFHTILSCAPEMYDDMWVGGKCMYKLEPAAADGGKVIIYAPHIHEVSSVHGKTLMKIGYHTRDFFAKQWKKYQKHPWGVVAHATHVKGIGTYKNGVEKPRVEVILATGIPEAVCRKINLGYMDWRKINKADYENKEHEGILYVPKAGEILYRVKSAAKK